MIRISGRSRSLVCSSNSGGKSTLGNRVEETRSIKKKETNQKGGLRDERCGPFAPSREGGIRVDRVCEGWLVQEEMQVDVVVGEVRPKTTTDHGRELGCVLCDVK